MAHRTLAIRYTAVSRLGACQKLGHSSLNGSLERALNPPELDKVTNATARVDKAFDWCESVTRMQARDFYYGIGLLPPNKRATLCAVYALIRRIDDIGDGDFPWNDKLAALSQVRRSLQTSTTPATHVAARALAGLSVSGLPHSGASCELDRALSRRLRADPSKSSGWLTGHHLFVTPRGDLTM